MSKAVNIYSSPNKVEYIFLADIFKIPSPKAKEGITLKTQAIDSPNNLVDSISLRISIIKGAMDPIRK